MRMQVIRPADRPTDRIAHDFIGRHHGTERLRQVDIHASGHFMTEWME